MHRDSLVTPATPVTPVTPLLGHRAPLTRASAVLVHVTSFTEAQESYTVNTNVPGVRGLYVRSLRSLTSYFPIVVQHSIVVRCVVDIKT